VQMKLLLVLVLFGVALANNKNLCNICFSLVDAIQQNQPPQSICPKGVQFENCPLIVQQFTSSISQLIGEDAESICNSVGLCGDNTYEIPLLVQLGTLTSWFGESLSPKGSSGLFKFYVDQIGNQLNIFLGEKGCDLSIDITTPTANKWHFVCEGGPATCVSKPGTLDEGWYLLNMTSLERSSCFVQFNIFVGAHTVSSMPITSFMPSIPIPSFTHMYPSAGPIPVPVPPSPSTHVSVWAIVLAVVILLLVIFTICAVIRRIRRSCYHQQSVQTAWYPLQEPPSYTSLMYGQDLQSTFGQKL